MQFLQAASAFNKLKRMDNLPYVIDEIKILADGISLELTSFEGMKEYVCYKSIEELKREWNVVNNFMDLQTYKKYNYEDFDS